MVDQLSLLSGVVLQAVRLLPRSSDYSMCQDYVHLCDLCASGVLRVIHTLQCTLHEGNGDSARELKKGLLLCHEQSGFALLYWAIPRLVTLRWTSLLMINETMSVLNIHILNIRTQP